MNPCLSSKPCSEDEKTSPVKNPSSNFLILPLPYPPFNFMHTTPISRQRLSSIPNFPLLIDNVGRELQKAIVSNVDKCLKMLHSLSSRNGVLEKMMSFSSCLQHSLQIPGRSRWNPGMPSNANFAAILPGDSVAGIVVTNGILNFLNIYNTVLIVRLVLTWFPNAPPAVVSPLSTLCDPYLNIFRGIIPPLGGTLDLSPILAFLVLNAFTSAAAALPAELPSEDASKDISSQITASPFTTSQKKWMRRLAGKK